MTSEEGTFGQKSEKNFRTAETQVAAANLQCQEDPGGVLPSDIYFRVMLYIATGGSKD